MSAGAGEARILDVTDPVRLALPEGFFEVTSFLIVEGGRSAAHLALHVGSPSDGALLRIASACVTSEVFGCGRCDCAEQLRRSLRLIAREGSGLLTYHPSDEGYGLGLHEKIRAYAEGGSPESGESHRICDIRTFAPAALIVAHFALGSVRLLSANERKRNALRARGIEAHLTALDPAV